MFQIGENELNFSLLKLKNEAHVCISWIEIYELQVMILVVQIRIDIIINSEIIIDLRQALKEHQRYQRV